MVKRSSSKGSTREPETVSSSAVVPYYANAARSESTDLAKNTNGTPDEPIWVGDDDDDQESIVAIRGTRRTEEQGGATSTTKPRAKKQPPSSSGTTRSSARSQSSKSQASTPTSKSQSTKSRSSSTKESSSSSSSSKKSPSSRLHIDITALDEELDDPALEKELEDIALTGRGGLISGTPAADDLEKGKKKAPAQPKKKTPAFEEDDADKSWHGALPSRADSNKKMGNRKRLLFAVVLLTLLGAVGVVLYNVLLSDEPAGDQSAPPQDGTGATLTERQQTMHNIISEITVPNILEDPTSPQYAARRWLLFQDTEIIGDEVSRVLQRYVLASFFFATGGGDSWAENQWLQGNECGDVPWEGLNCDTRQEVRTLMLGTFLLKETVSRWK
jgi:hypothetical protein